MLLFFHRDNPFQERILTKIANSLTKKDIDFENLLKAINSFSHEMV
jgi:hypothetical protein